MHFEHVLRQGDVFAGLLGPTLCLAQRVTNNQFYTCVELAKISRYSQAKVYSEETEERMMSKLVT